MEVKSASYKRFYCVLEISQLAVYNFKSLNSYIIKALKCCIHRISYDPKYLNKKNNLSLF